MYLITVVLTVYFASCLAADYDHRHDDSYEYGTGGCKPPLFVDGSYYPPIDEMCPIGTILHFSCKNSFTLKGTTSAKCVRGGHWDPPIMPVCHKFCPKPIAPQHGFYQPTRDRYEPGSKCQYKCKSGYELKGDEYSTCLDTGYWSHKKAVQCHDINECAHYKSPCSYNSVCHNTIGGYRCVCKAGYHKQSDGLCYAKACEVPHLPEHCTYSPSTKKSWYFGDKIHFHCPSGYDLKGSAYATCLQGGKWDNKAPICYRQDGCRVPYLPKNTGYSPKGQNIWYVGQKITFYCPAGHDMKGNKYAVCKPGGKWDYQAPSCYRPTPKVCYLPHLNQHCGYTPQHKTTWYSGEKITFYCPKGYKLKGSAYAVCSEYGKWDTKPPLCIAPEVCYAPHLTHNSYYTPTQKAWRVGEKVRYICPKGLKLNGYDHATCLHGGKWDKPSPICVRPTCHVPVLPKHCSYAPRHQKTWLVGGAIRFFCPRGYVLKGFSYATCTHEGKWTNPPPTCNRIPVYCNSPVLHSHARFSSSYRARYAVGEITGFACPPGYYLKGYKSAKCLYNGRWSNPAPTCYRHVYNHYPKRYGYGKW